MSESLLNPGVLRDGDLELVAVELREGLTAKNGVPEYKFEMRLKSANQKAGNISLRISLNRRLAVYGGHIGYEVLPEHRGNRYSARSCRLLFGLAKKHNINPLLITCSPDNIPSVRTCDLIGAKLIDQKSIEIEQGETRLTNYYHVQL